MESTHRTCGELRPGRPWTVWGKIRIVMPARVFAHPPSDSPPREAKPDSMSDLTEVWALCTFCWNPAFRVDWSLATK